MCVLAAPQRLDRRAKKNFIVSSCVVPYRPVPSSALQYAPVWKSRCHGLWNGLFKSKLIVHTPRSMGKSLGSRTLIDQLPLWDEDAESGGPAPAEPTPEAEPRLKRSIGPVSQQAPAAGGPKTHCPAGHVYDQANTYVDRHGWRSCRTCKRVSDRRRRERTAKRLTPEQRIMRSRLAAYRLHATTTPGTRPGRRGRRSPVASSARSILTACCRRPSERSGQTLPDGPTSSVWRCVPLRPAGANSGTEAGGAPTRPTTSEAIAEG